MAGRTQKALVWLAFSHAHAKLISCHRHCSMMICKDEQHDAILEVKPKIFWQERVREENNVNLLTK